MLQSKVRRGELDREVLFIQKVLDNTKEGEDYVESWEPVSNDPLVMARKKELPGVDLVVGDQVKLYQKTVWTVDYRTDLSISNRLYFDSKVYQIISVNEPDFSRGTYVDVLCSLLDNVTYAP